MSALKRVTMTDTAPRKRNPFSALRETQIVNTDPALPFEIISRILDHCTVPCLVRCARTSKRMKEMIYEDTRWVQRLEAMQCWSQDEAGDTAQGEQRDGINGEQAQARSHDTSLGSKAGNGGQIPKVTLFDASTKTHDSPAHPHGQNELRELDDGFDAISISSNNSTVQTKPQGPVSRLDVFKKEQIVRAGPRKEYARIHATLSPLYTDAVRCQNPTQAVVFRTFRDPNHQAIMLNNLNRFAKSDLAVGWSERKAKIETMTDAFEQAVTREFEQAVDLDDVSVKMPKYARVLVSLNGGHKCVEIFIEKSPLIKSIDASNQPLDCFTNAGPERYNAEKSYGFFSKVSSKFNEQIPSIDQVFPPSIDVVVPLVQRIGKKIISEYVTTVFDEAHRASIEVYLKAVPTICEQALACAKSLRPAVGSGDEFYEAVDRVMADVFEPHADLYLAEELSFFKTRSDASVSEWERRLSEQDASMQSMFMSNVNRQVDKRDFLSSFKKAVMMPVNVVSTPFASKPATAKALVNGDNVVISGNAMTNEFSRSSSPGLTDGPTITVSQSVTSVPEPPTTELAAKTAIINSRLEGIRGLFSIEVALNLVHLAKAGIERAAVFLNLGGHFATDARSQCELIFIALLQILGTRHIQSGFDQAISHLSEYKPREVKQHSPNGVEPLVTFLELVNVGDLIQQMLDVFYEQEIVASKLTAKDDFLNPAVKEKKKFEQMLDSRVAAGLNKGIEVLMDEIEYICATTQVPEDFNPEGDTSNKRVSKKFGNDIMDIGPTETARKIVDIVDKHTKMLIGSTDKNTLDVFNQEVGVRLFATLCKHLKRQRISTTGSIKLISDTTHYHNYMQTLRNKPLLAYYGALRSLAQIYLVDRSDAKSLAAIIADGERFGGVWTVEEVYEFATRRADWYAVKTDVERGMYGMGCVVM